MNKLFITLLVAAIFLVGVEAFRAKSKDGNTKRTLRVISDPHRFEVRAVRKDTKTKDLDAIQYVFDTNWVPRFIVRYFTRDEDSSDKTRARWMLWKIVEYTDNNTAPGFDPELDTIESHYRLWVRSFTNMAVSQTTDSDGVTVHKVCTSLNGAVPRPDVTLCAYATEASTTADGSKIDPNSIKWSISIANYPYVKTDSRLAIKVSFDSRHVVKDFDPSSDPNVEVNPGESVVELSDDEGSKALASWVTSVDVTGASCSATASVQRSIIREGEFSKDVDVTFPANNDTDRMQVDRTWRVSYFSFLTDCQPTSITWDPEFGVISPDSGVSRFVPSLALLAVLAAFLLL